MRCASLALIGAGLLSGCGSMVASFKEGIGGESNEQYLNVDKHSSYPIMARQSFEQVNLVEMIDPLRESSAWSRSVDGEGRRDASYGVRYDIVLNWFRTNGQMPEIKRMHRNSVQDKILAAASSRCNVYKTFLRRQQSDVNFLLGTATTVSGVLGAVLQGANASRNLAGMAGLFSGVQAEYNQAYFSNLAAHVIVQGIELKQNRLREQLVKGRQPLDVTEYSMEAAINDAIIVDGSCSAVAGLLEAQESIKEVERPGMAMAARAMAGAKALDELNSKPILELLQDGQLNKLFEVAGTNVASLMVTASRAGELGGGVALNVTRTANLRQALGEHLSGRASEIGREFRARRDQAAEGKKGQVDGAKVAETFKALVDPLLTGLAADNGAVKICLDKLATSFGEFGQKNSLLQLAVTEPARTTARLEADISLAKLKAVLSHVEAVKLAVMAEIDQQRDLTLSKLPGSTDLGNFSQKELELAFKDVKGDPTKIKASCP